ncbi:MAG: MBL fold metallo-hydrolase [Deltaproteobacteria bacterium]|nr:MBL fold metallo-hydrolase [Deltaproteobacteria bacterium]
MARDFIKFLGTAGARVVVSKQLRASGGTWISSQGQNIYLDPGPGGLVRCLSAKPKLDPTKLDAIILSHRHLDHAADVNVMIEAMTEGGFKRRGLLFAPQDAFSSDPVILEYLHDYLKGIEILEEGKSYTIGEVRFCTPVRHLHQVETYGLRFELPRGRLSFITDTLFFPELIEHYRAQIVIINVVRNAPRDNHICHLTLNDAKELIRGISPRVAILTHFGMTMLRAKPWELAARLKEETGIEVMAARDGMSLYLDEFI